MAHHSLDVLDVALVLSQSGDGATNDLESQLRQFNSQSLTRESLSGKVVLFEFWTYSCINWRLTLPYVSAWEDKYKDNAFVVIGSLHQN